MMCVVKCVIKCVIGKIKMPESAIPTGIFQTEKEGFENV
jgi:hypothetical protein